MKRYLVFTLLTLFTAVPAVAQAAPKEVVSDFYKSYRVAIEQPGSWMEKLLSAQGDVLEKPLADNLRKLAAGDPNKGEPYLDFDPFSNSQTGMESYTIGDPTMSAGLAYVPVTMRLDGQPGPARMRARVVLREHGLQWKIANVVYPAENGMAAWDLSGYLKDAFQP